MDTLLAGPKETERVSDSRRRPGPPHHAPAGVRTYFGPVSPAVRVALNHPEAAVEASDVLGQPSHLSGRLRGCGGRGLEPVQQVAERFGVGVERGAALAGECD